MIHRAGMMDEAGVQLCVRCCYILNDYRNAMVPDGTPPLRGWEPGAAVEVIPGNPRYSGLTDQAPDCEPITGRPYIWSYD